MSPTSPKVALLTICSNNYLAKAITMARSIPSCDVYALIVDLPSRKIDYDSIDCMKIYFARELGIPEFRRNSRRYSIVELNTSVKPFFLIYITQKFPEYDFVYYIDPDIFFYDNLGAVNACLASSLCVLTPHVLQPLPLDGRCPSDQTLLQYGLYNLGFFGINPRHLKARDLLEWWGERCEKQCKDDVQNGYFVDQLWMTLVPMFFEGVMILRHWGCNMGPWNLHERHLTTADGSHFYVNGIDRLIFYHFSGYRSPAVPCVDPYNRSPILDRPDLQPLYGSYYDKLLSNGEDRYSRIEAKL